MIRERTTLFALMDVEVRRSIPLLAVNALTPVSVTTCFVGTLAAVKEQVVALILAHDEVRGHVVLPVMVDVVNDGPYRKVLP